MSQFDHQWQALVSRARQAKSTVGSGVVGSPHRSFPGGGDLVVRGAGAEAGQVEGDHLVPLGQSVEDRIPDLPAAADAVDQDDRAAAPAPMVMHRASTY